MHPFIYQRAENTDAALEAAGRTSREGVPATEAAAQYIAGGTNLSDYMRLEVMRPQRLVDVNHLSRQRYGRIETSDAGLRLGALVRMADVEDSEVVKTQYPVIFDTMKLAATRQIRNMASLGGNVLQRTRCEYFREISFPCNKRAPGSGCSAIGGANRQHAVLGTSDDCIAAYPGDFGHALVALDASVDIIGPGGSRTIPFAELHRLPGGSPNVETSLSPGDLIVGYTVPAGPWTRRSRYVKVRDRDSYQFALTSAAVALDLEGDTVREARIALGGVATKPWRARQAEAALQGRPLSEETAREAAEVAFADAVAYEQNAFKIPIGKATIVRALLEAQAMEI